MRKRDLESLKKLLTEQREELRGNAKKTRSEDIHVDPDDFPDEIDIASSEVNLQFAGRLREREHAPAPPELHRCLPGWSPAERRAAGCPGRLTYDGRSTPRPSVSC